MKRIAGLGLVAWVALAGGCSSEPEQAAVQRDTQNETPYEQEFATADTSEAYRTGDAAPVSPVQGGNTLGGTALTATGNLRGVGGGAAPAGAVTVTEQGPGTQILVSVTRHAPGTRMQASIVQGDCQQPGAVVATVPQVIEVGPEGIVNFNGTVQVATNQILDGRHAVRLATPDGQTTLACSDLPALTQAR